MHLDTTAGQVTGNNVIRPHPLRIGVIASGYLVAFFGALSTWSIPLLASLLALVGGLTVASLLARGNCAAPRMGWRTFAVWIAGSAVILGILFLIGEEKVRHWTPHPAGYQIAWFVCLSAFRHLRQILIVGRR
jgi:hypothetical protein